MKARLQKVLAEAGLGSRRTCEELIRAGRVVVDGTVATLGCSADPAVEAIIVDGHPVSVQRKEFWLLNKPRGVLSAVLDERGRKTVVDLVPSGVRLFPVGRLDLDSTGLLVLTNDGDLAAALLHPRYHVEKEYVVTVDGEVRRETVKRLRGGIDLGDCLTGPAEVQVVELRGSGEKGSTVLRMVLREGRKRQVRRMLESTGHRVTALHRSRFAGLTDEGLALGQARRLTPEEVVTLQRAPQRG